MKLTTITNVSLDGVTQGHRRIEVGSGHDAGGFERFGWGPPLLDDEASTFTPTAVRTMRRWGNG